MATTRTSREDAKRQTREALLLAALELFTEKGIEGPSLDAISERAGYTRGAFYVHFSSRDDLVAGLMERILEEYLQLIVQTADAGGDLVRSVQMFLSRVEPSPASQTSPFLAVGAGHIQLVSEACRRSEVVRDRFLALLDQGIERLTLVISAGQAAGTVRADIQARPVAALLVYAVFGVLTLRPSGFAEPPVASAAELLRMLTPRANSAS